MKSRTLLATIAIVIAAIINSNSFAQPLLVEDFDYPSGDSLVSHTWTAHSGSGNNSIMVSTIGLSYTNYAGSNIGLSAAMVQTGEDVNTTFEAQTTGNVYAAFLANISTAGADGDYFFHFKDGASTFRGRVFVQKHPTEEKIRFGVNRGSNSSKVSWTENYYDLNITHLIVLKYSFAEGVKNDTCSLFVNPPINSNEPTAAAISPEESNVSDFTSISAIALRQGNATHGSILKLDGIRVATTWSEAVKFSGTTDTEAPVAIFDPANEATEVPINVKPTITFNESIYHTNGTAIDSSNISTLLILKDQENTPISFDATINISKTVITITPSNTLQPSTSYSLTINKVEDLSGNETESQTITFQTVTSSTIDNLFFSEYIEGNSNNKAIEIYNPNDTIVSLSGFYVKLFGNGSATATQTLVLSGTIEANGVYVIAHPSAEPEIMELSDTTSQVTYFNGDDALGLYKNNTLIDVFGTIGTDPGTSWNVAGQDGATSDHTLVRKPSVTQGNTDWTQQAGSSTENSEWIVYPNNTLNYLGNHIFGANNETNITSFALSQQISDAVINDTLHTITAEVVHGTDITTLVPEFTLSYGAQATIGTQPQISGVSVVDFTNPVTYTVTAENGTDIQNWTVTVTAAQEQSSEANILTFTVPEQVGTSAIDTTSATVTAMVKHGTDLTSLTPEITISTAATIEPATGVVQNFTNPVNYTVTAQNGTTKQWTVTVTYDTITTIHQIQYTTEASGNSPYTDQVVTTTGIVTAIHGTAGFYLQNGTGLWNGLYIFKNVQSISMPALGDSIIVRGKVVEYYNLTEIKDIEYLIVCSSNNPLPAALTLTADQINESTEGILINAQNYKCIHDGAGNHWTSKYIKPEAPNDTLKVFRQLYELMPIVGKRYHITGVVSYNYGAYKIAPRNADDIIEIEENIAPTITDINIYPEPPVVGQITFVQSTINDDGPQSSLVKKFFYGLSPTSVTNELPLTPIGVSGTRYLAEIPAQNNPTTIYFKITANDGEFETTHDGQFNIATSIEQIGQVIQNIYPNPTTGKTYIEVTKTTLYSVLDITGKKIVEGQLQAGQNEIELTNLPKGIYIISTTSVDGTVEISKLIKQ